MSEHTNPTPARRQIIVGGAAALAAFGLSPVAHAGPGTLVVGLQPAPL